MEIFICSPLRTAIGSFGGSLAALQAHVLGSKLIAKIISDQNLDPKDISEIISTRMKLLYDLLIKSRLI